LADKLGSNLDTGLSTELAAKRLQEEGRNELTKPPKPTLLMLFIMQLTGFIIILLMVAAVASILVNATSSRASDPLQYTTGIAIFVIVLLNAGIAAWTEHKAGGALEALTKMSQATIDVMRGGVQVTVDTTDIVRGDIVVLKTGDVVPADLRLIEAQDIKVSEMALTGEPDDVSKTSKLKPKREGEPEKLLPENMVFSGCPVANGSGRGIVMMTGMGTRIGHIFRLIAESENGGKPKKRCFCLPDTSAEATPLQRSLEKLGGRIGVLAIIVCIVVFIIGVAVGRTDPMNPDDSSAVLYMILIAVTLAVAAIPEGIPLCVTISLSIGCSDMVHKNVLVRKLAAVETLGSASVICSDKTGTLTEGKMTMVHMWSGGVSYDVSGKGFEPKGSVTRCGQSADAGKDLCVRTSLLAALLCCNTTLKKVTDNETGEERWEPKGNSSEAPIVVAAHKIEIAEESSEYRRIFEVPFSSSRKMMLTVTDVSARDSLGKGGMSLPSGTTAVAVCKGAPNYILDHCEEQLLEDGSVEKMTDRAKAEVLRIVDDYSTQALRVLAVAVRCMPELPFSPDDDEMNTDQKFALCRERMCLLGLVASIDPERDGVKDSVERARGAGIRVVMITGDYVKTAEAIARNVSILQQKDDTEQAAVDCVRLRPDGQYISEGDIDELTKSVRVFARAKPEDKLEIVQSLQRQGYVTAMTGDGVNDAPALNQADIGVAMGIQGTEVAKGASDMVLTDDNFCSIVAAVEKGRVIYAGIQKFVAFIMSVHIAEVMQIFVCIVAGVPVMRSPLQILFLILVTDLPPSIALGMEPGEKTILMKRPRPKEEPVVLSFMWLSQVMNGACLTLVIVAVYLVSLAHYCDGEVLQDNITSKDGLMDARTVAFISLVFSENVRSYCSRSFDQPIWRGMFGNKQMQKAIFMAEVSMLIAVFVPVLSTDILELRGTKIGLWGWLMALAGPVGTVVLCEACKVITYYQVKQHEQRLEARQLALEQATKKKPASIAETPLPEIARNISGELVRAVSGSSQYNKL